MAEKDIKIEDDSNEIVDEIKLDVEDSNLDNNELSLDKDEVEIEPVSESLEATPEDNEDLSSNEEKNISEYALDDEELDDYSIQKKQTKLQKILTAIAAILLITLSVGLILYFLGFFDEKKEEPKIEKKVEKKIEEKKFDFKSRDIDPDKLNEKFDRLTKYNPSLETKRAQEEAKRKAQEEAKLKAEEEKKRIEEIERLKEELNNQKQALEDRRTELLSQKEELVKLKEQLLEEVEQKKEELKQLVENSSNEKVDTEIKVVQEPIQEAVEQTNLNTTQMHSNTFLPLINVAIIKNELTKDYLEKVEKIDKNILLCRDNKNNIEIYVGPYEMPSARKNLLNKFLSSGFNKAMLVDLTKEEFNKRCNY